MRVLSPDCRDVGSFVPADPLVPGRRVGKYEVVKRLASGGMAEIYLARARGIEGFEKSVVLKRILPQYAADEGFVQMFLNEARVAATLDHSNIASVYDIDQCEGIYFYAMEYLQGEDMGHILREVVRRAIAVPLENALSIAMGVAAGLHHAHEKRRQDGSLLGLVHRDVSPSNVVVTYEGGVKLVDFGLAKVTAHPDRTESVLLKGKPAYMSPEQCRGQPLDRRTDIFSLGVVLYEMTTLTRLFKGESDIQSMQLVEEALVPAPSTRVRDYPPELERIVLRALQRRREERFSTARDLELALDAFARSSGLTPSSARLAEWMTSTFDERREPWATGTFASSSDAAELEAFGRGGSKAGATVIEGRKGETQRRLSARPGRGVRVGVASGLAGALVGGALLVVAGGARQNLPIAESRPAERASAPPAPPPAGHHPAPAAPPPAPDRPAVAVTPLPPASVKPAAFGKAAPPAKARQGPRRGRASEGSDKGAGGAGFSESFARRQGEIARCVSSHMDVQESAGKLEVRFRVAADGTVSSAEILPPEVATTPLGACIGRVATSTKFGARSGPVTFRIPVTVRLKGSPDAP